jgi:hypothetical protein
MVKKNSIPTALALGLSAALAGCGDIGAGNGSGSSSGQPMNFQHVGDSTSYSPSSAGLQYSTGAAAIGDPTVDYLLALRTASLKLRGNLPGLDEQIALQNAVNSSNPDDAQRVYEGLVDQYINGPANAVSFNRQMFYFWRNTLRMGGSAPLTALLNNSLTDMRPVNLDTAPALAAMLIAQGRPLTQLFTAQDPACPTFNLTATTADKQFTDGNCNTGAMITGSNANTNMGNNVPSGSQAGILTNPGLMAQYYSNFGFRRARLIQELFACSRYPAELAGKPQQIGPYLYSSPWPVDSVSGNVPGQQPVFMDGIRPRRLRGAKPVLNNTEYVDFKTDCRNCHTTLNHRAPLFGVFDQVGYRDPSNLLMVTSTATSSPFAQIQEYLYQCNPTAADAGENPMCKNALAWKFGGPLFDFGGTGIPNFLGFGQEMAKDPQVAKCFMIRAWNYAYSRDDVVQELALVPDNVIAEMATYFTQNNYNMKTALFKLYTSPNFIRF